MSIRKILLKKLSKIFPKPCSSQFKLTGNNLCHECVIRHDELCNGKEICFDDLKYSCYTYIFYETAILTAIVPMLLKEFIHKNKFEIEFYIVDIFFKNMQNNEFIALYSLEQKQIIFDTLVYLESLYFMKSFHTWDYETEKLIHHYDDEIFYNLIHATTSFWKVYIGVFHEKNT